MPPFPDPYLVPSPALSGEAGVPLFLPAPEQVQVDPEAERKRLEMLLRQVEAKCRGWHQKVKESRDDFLLATTGDDNPDTDPSERVHLTDLANAVIVGSAVLNLAGNRLSLARYEEDDHSKELAGRIERFLKGCVQGADQRRGSNLQSDITLALMRDMVAVVRWWADEQALADQEWWAEDYEATCNVPPVDMDIIDPLSFFPMLGTRHKFKYVIHKTSRTIQEMYDDWGHDKWAISQLEREYHFKMESQRYNDARECCDYWGWAWDGQRWHIENAILYDRKVIVRPCVRMDEYKVFPWEMAAAYEDRTESDYAKRWLPFTYWAKPHVRRRERLTARIDALVTTITQTPHKHIVPQGAQGAEIEGGDKKVLELQQGEDFIPASAQYGQVPIDLNRQLQRAEIDTELALLPRAMFGMGSGGSGYAYDQLQEGARLRLIGPRDQLANLMRQLYRGVASLVAWLRPGVPVAAIYRDDMARHPRVERVILDGRDLLGWLITVQWSAELPGDAMRKSAQATQLQGMLSHETIIGEILGMPDPVLEIKRRLKERVQEQHPLIAEMYAMQAYRDLGGRPTLTEAEVLQVMLYLEAEEAKLIAAGAPPEEIEQHLMGIRQGILMQVRGQVPVEQALGFNGPGAGSPMGGNVGKQGPAEARAPAGALGDPANGMADAMRGGAPPPGNFADASGALSQLANDLRGGPPPPG